MYRKIQYKAMDIKNPKASLSLSFPDKNITVGSQGVKESLDGES